PAQLVAVVDVVASRLADSLRRVTLADLSLGPSLRVCSRVGQASVTPAAPHPLSNLARTRLCSGISGSELRAGRRSERVAVRGCSGGDRSSGCWPSRGGRGGRRRAARE